MIKKEVFFFLFPCSISAPLVVTYVEEPVENEEGPRIFLSTVLLEAPLNKTTFLSLGEDGEKE